jgi:uncharacterized protein (TIGR03905 family)
MHYQVYPRGVCPTELEFDLEGDRVTNIRYHGGCNGGLKTIASLIDGWTVDQIAEKLEGVTCGPKSTSCSNELVRELKKALADQEISGDAMNREDNEEESSDESGEEKREEPFHEDLPL